MSAEQGQQSLNIITRVDTAENNRVLTFMTPSKVSKKNGFKVAFLAAICTGTMFMVGCATKPVYSGSARPTIQTDARGVPNFYHVKRGDTVSQIAKRYGLNYRHIGALNRLDNRYTIYTGQWLKLWEANNGNAAPGSYRPYDQNVPNYNTGNTAPYPSASPPTQGSYPAPPVSGQAPANNNGGVVSAQGYRYPTSNPVIRNYDVNGTSKGMWFGGKVGDPVLASNGGEVLYAGDELPEYGNLVMIRHDATTITVYAHNNQLLVKEGDRVVSGQRIATMGSTGQTNQVALEFQVRQNGVPVDPRAILGL